MLGISQKFQEKENRNPHAKSKDYTKYLDPKKLHGRHYNCSSSKLGKSVYPCIHHKVAIPF